MCFLDKLDENSIQNGINHWEERTCIKFEKTKNTSQPHLQFIKGSGCWSYVGMVYYQNGQQISIGSGCSMVSF